MEYQVILTMLLVIAALTIKEYQILLFILIVAVVYYYNYMEHYSTVLNPNPTKIT